MGCALVADGPLFLKLRSGCFETGYPPKTPTYPTFGKGKSSTQKCLGMIHVRYQEGITMPDNSNIFQQSACRGEHGLDKIIGPLTPQCGNVHSSWRKGLQP